MGSFRQIKAIAAKNFQIQSRHIWSTILWWLLLPLLTGLVSSIYIRGVYDAFKRYDDGMISRIHLDPDAIIMQLVFILPIIIAMATLA